MLVSREPQLELGKQFPHVRHDFLAGFLVGAMRITAHDQNADELIDGLLVEPAEGQSHSLDAVETALLGLDDEYPGTKEKLLAQLAITLSADGRSAKPHPSTVLLLDELNRPAA